MGNQTSLKHFPKRGLQPTQPSPWIRQCCGLFIWVLVEESVATAVFIDGCFCKNFHAGFHSRVTEKTKAFLYEPHCLAFRSCISGEFELLNFFRLV